MVVLGRGAVSYERGTPVGTIGEVGMSSKVCLSKRQGELGAVFTVCVEPSLGSFRL